MSTANLKAKQKEARKQCLDNILTSQAPWKLIAAGPGTGKTHTFREMLAKRAGDNNLALTFISKLANEIQLALGESAEVKTFHAYCKKVLHRQNGRVDLAPYLNAVIKEDAELLGSGFLEFTTKFQTLADKSPEVAFFLRRGDYYDAVGFDDSVYRLLQQVQKGHNVLPDFGLIVVDEFQDFNPLEVAFIEELAKKGDILIVGDDDQAVYYDRSASPDFLRQLHASGKYATFPLPYCSRCTSSIVSATNDIITKAQSLGFFPNRISKPYECYLESKEPDSLRYPKLLTARFSMAKVIPKYIKREIERIAAEDITESRAEKDGYPTVLIVGAKQYLTEVSKQLKPHFPQLEYIPSQDIDYGVVDAYKLLRNDGNSNLGWRIILKFFCTTGVLKNVVVKSDGGKPMVELMDNALLNLHRRALELVDLIVSGYSLTEEERRELNGILGEEAENVIDHFTTKEKVQEVPLDPSKPTIKLTSFVGCKGLSAGHVFVVGAHAGSIPKDTNSIQDLEISQFIVALTRTRKCCHILSNKWLHNPKNPKGGYYKPFEPSPFISWIGTALKLDLGELSAKDFK